jgi:hypothetical protein
LKTEASTSFARASGAYLAGFASGGAFIVQLDLKCQALGTTKVSIP